MRKYYEAYDDRYRQVHEDNLRWFAETPSPVVEETIAEYAISPDDRILEIGCGEGRDAIPLLKKGYHLLATDISPEAISWCAENYPQFAEHFRTLNCITDRLNDRFDFIYAVAVIHMLVEDDDRDGFYGFIRDQLTDEGIALICTMGDGRMERRSDVSTAFDLQERIHESSGRTVHIAGTSYRAVAFDTFRKELDRNDLQIIKEGMTDIEPDYAAMMYAVVRRK